VRVLGQRLEAWLQQLTIVPFQLGQTGVAQPVGHAAQDIEQVAQLPGHAIAAGTQPQVADRSLDALGLQQRLTRLGQDELFLFRAGTAQQVDDAAGLRGRQRLAAHGGQHGWLVAHGQPRQLPCQAGRQ
jgi:hypothetical protein